MAGAPPFPEDFLDQIVNVNWGGLKLATVEFSYELTTNYVSGGIVPAFAATVSSPVMNGSLAGPFGPAVSPPAVPSATFRKDKSLWCYSPFSYIENSTVSEVFNIIDRAEYGIAYAGGVLSSLVSSSSTIFVPFIIDNTGDFTGGGGLSIFDGYNGLYPIGGDIGPHGGQFLTDVILVNYLILAGIPSHLLLGPHLLNIISSHNATTDVVFDHRMKSTVSFINLSKVKGNQLQLQAKISAEPFNVSIRWDITCATWKKAGNNGFPRANQFPRNNTAPLSALNNPIIHELDWPNIPTTPIGVSTQQITRTAESDSPAYTVNFYIDLHTLAVTSDSTPPAV